MFPSVIIIIIINIKDWTSLIRSVSTVTTVRANISSVFQLFSFLVVCSGTISTGFGFVTFFASVNASSVCIHLSVVCIILCYYTTRNNKDRHLYYFNF